MNDAAYRRDMDLVRSLLMALERTGPLIAAEDAFDELDLPEKDPHRVLYHLNLLTDSGLVALEYDSAGRPNYWRLTWQGHEFIEAVRAEDRWQEVRNASAKAGGFVLTVLYDTAVALLQAQVKQILGLP